ncbi:septation ring formation regulator EzrA [Ileibacterium valens]|uniref:Negative regulator of septation ring formation n=3 Tax=Ileibacterium valens TaxID=1862668 RepID=A0A1U7NF89_9FIRM|nr:septation ring formation regulator EzrA [Ileibacterium valens]OLU38796.1 negative regulator of septation ring formation [Ileibacterium valens]OLU38866.1 negative regulator of septation ring formation [Erysipelotrichaceae bacterium NYU-BL-E8]OLU43345.1 negative regulator of septation ring formation [Erysipelotrichaceae bacterium NYU-BL-F16]
MENIWNEVQAFFINAYDYVSKHFSIELLTYLGIAVIVLLLVWIANRLVKRNKARKRLADLETEINDIRNNSLQYKFNKATAFARVNDDIIDRVKNLTPKYDICLKSIESCEDIYEKADEFINKHRYKKAMKTMDELEGVIDDTRDRIRIVNQSLDRILAKETEVREKSNAAKERFRNLRNIYTQNRPAYYTGAGYVDDQIEDIEEAFNSFEEWMFASEFNKAKDEIDKISARTNELSAIVRDYPDLYSKAKLLLPQALNDVEMQVQEIEEKNIDISYLEADEKMDAIRNAIEDAIIKLDNGNVRKAESALNTISDQILVLQDDIAQEKKAFDEIHGDLETNFAAIDEIDSELKEIVTLYANIKDRFGLEDWTKRFEAAREQMELLKNQRSQIQEQLAKEDTLQVDVVHSYRRFAEKTVNFGKSVKEMKRMLVGASSDENRARKQVIKLQLILNEVRLNTINKQLPSISDQFAEDLQVGEEKIARVRKILEHSPLDVQALNRELQDSIDFVYKLYNNANNLVGVAVMVENAIVFGNRFRSTYPSLDSDLTRAEVCYQNGEYTRALKIAIQAIENLHPGIYEKLIAEKNPAVMNLV